MGLFNQQGGQAANFAYFFLLNISKSLPPLIKNFQTSTGNSRVNIFAGNNSVMAVTFHAMENRTQTVTFTATIQNADGSETGMKAFDALSITLDPDGADLPWEKDVSLSWNGTPVGGSALASGNYLLNSFLTDGDGNVSPSVSTVFSIPGPPTVNMTSAIGSGGDPDLYADFSGVASGADPPSTIIGFSTTTAEFDVGSPVGMQSIVITDPNGDAVPFYSTSMMLTGFISRSTSAASAARLASPAPSIS